MDETPINYASPHAEEERVLLNMFPAEVWEIIFYKCDSNSILLLINSLNSFRNWMLPKRTAYLFPLVLITLGRDYINLIVPPSLKINRSAHNQTRCILPEESKIHTLTKSGLRATLKFRQVCKHWCKAVNALHLEELRKGKLDIDRILGPKPTGSLVPWMQTYLTTNIKFENFLQMISTDGFIKKSNFIGRAIVIVNWNVKMFKVLEQIGHAVWHCTMFFDSKHQGLDAVYSNVRYALKFLPNLKSLEITDSGKYFLHEDHGTSESFTTQRVLGEMNQDPIGRLKNLELLQTTYLPWTFFDELVRRNSHVKTLVALPSTSCCETVKQKYRTWSEIGLIHVSFRILSDSDIEMLCKPYIHWTFKKLHLSVEIGSCSIWNRLFKLFKENWKNTTITLRYFGREWEGLGKNFCFVCFLAQEVELRSK